MAERLTVTEASAAYERSMRNIAAPGAGICAVCWTFIAPTYTTCLACSRQPDRLDAVVPITYSEHLGQMHTALRGYKDSPPRAQRYAMVRLAAILWRFAELHERCVARAVGVDGFDLVTAVPSSTPEADQRRGNLRTMISWCAPLADRHQQMLTATGRAAPGRAYDEQRYEATGSLNDQRVLLIDDTWAAGGHAQSAAHALRAAGAQTVALIVIGRHVRPEWEISPGEHSGDRLEALPKIFDWSVCAVHRRPR